ncbi:cation:proton antiporter [Ensifer sp. IC4062]|nr:cation:proton antiporter [Ensifer sp. IC4062]MCA1441544.1 cation:proton antiporter [Ensifer sp. IC4062]
MAQTVLSAAIGFALLLLSAALLLTVLRIVRGPTLPDRVLGLDMLVAIAIGLIAVIAIKTGFDLYIDIAIALGLVGFLATVAFARFILTRGLAPEQSAEAASAKKTLPKRGKATQAVGRKHRGAR